MADAATSLAVRVGAERVWIARACVVAIVGAAMMAIASTYDVFSQTYDEPGHIAAGMEWLQMGRFTFEEQHPPLARVLVAAGPYLAGARLEGEGTMWEEGNRILYDGGRYQRTLALARMGTLVFFLTACAVVWAWSRRLAGESAAAVSVLLFSTTSPVLAHAGLATTDMGAAATIGAALLVFSRWLSHPGVGRSLALGVAVAVAVLTKLSALLFVPVGAAVLTLVHLRTRGGARASASYPRGLGLAAWTCVLAIWLAYRLSVRWFGSVPLPAPELVAGVYQVLHHSAIGHANFLLGERRLDGWWYYFPVVLGVKAPIPLLLLAVLGGVVPFLRGATERWERAVPALIALAMLLSVLPSRINAGVRYLLPAFLFLAISAGIAARWAWDRRHGHALARSLLLALVVWQLAGAIRRHPDHLPYFNELAGGHPERIVVDSDLDWGQDLLRLEEEVESRGLRELKLAYYGTAEPTQHLGAIYEPLDPGEVATGWVAVSQRFLAGIVNGRLDEGYAWIGKYKPVKRVGRSILLYDIPPADR